MDDEKMISYKKNPKIDFLMELIHCSFSLDYWLYASDGHLMESKSNNERIINTLFSVSELKDYMLEYGSENTNPLLLGSSLGEFWIAFFDHTWDSKVYYHVLGPVFIDNISNQTLQKRVNQYASLPLNWKQSFIRIVESFPIIPWTTLTQYLIMMHYTITGETIDVSSFVYQTTLKDTQKAIQEESDTQNDQNTPWKAEQILLNHVREGNLEYNAALANAANQSSGVKVNIGDSLRRSKDSVIVFTALCARASIEGGLPAQTAYTLQNQYTQSIEDAPTTSEIMNISHQMYQDYITRVHNLHLTPGLSPQIRNCCAYIDLHLTEHPSIDTLAKDTGYAAYYLSRRFKKEVGVSINEYIKQKQISVAKNLLETTVLSVQEISERLNFCSRSYFSDTFHKITGCSPTDYRDKNLRI